MAMRKILILFPATGRKVTSHCMAAQHKQTCFCFYFEFCVCKFCTEYFVIMENVETITALEHFILFIIMGFN